MADDDAAAAAAAKRARQARRTMREYVTKGEALALVTNVMDRHLKEHHGAAARRRTLWRRFVEWTGRWWDL